MQAFKRFAVRDISILIATLIAWVTFGQLSAEEGYLADFTGASLGLAAGICAWLAHEWGHLIAGAAIGGRFRAPARFFTVYLFGFDTKSNTQIQFIVMALGGFLATALVFLFVFSVLPADWLATRIVRGLVLLEIFVTVVLEVPGLVLGIIAYDRLPSVDVLGE